MLNSKGKDAIVNAANKYMEPGGGICGVIYSNAGPELISCCKDNYSSNMVNGEVRITPGFNIGMDIIHVLAPVYYEVKDPINELLKANKIRSKVDNRNEKLGYRMRESQTKKIPYTLVIGDKEMNDNTVNYRKHGVTDTTVVSINKFIDLLIDSIKKYQ